jgi:misacylated tRNA(Ala) deacylase
MKTQTLFRDNAYLRACNAEVIAVTENGFITDQTVFYPTGGGQPGDTGTATRAGGGTLTVIDTRKGEAPDTIIHLIAAGDSAPQLGETISLEIDWARRFAHMRFHSAMHLLCAVLKNAAVTGGALDATKARLDFDLPAESIDRDAIEAELNALILAAHPVTTIWITDEEMQARPELVRTMTVKPPMGVGRVRLLKIGENVDLQPCGGTHVANTKEIGSMKIVKIENKGKQNRRLVLNFA